MINVLPKTFSAAKSIQRKLLTEESIETEKPL